MIFYRNLGLIKTLDRQTTPRGINESGILSVKGDYPDWSTGKWTKIETAPFRKTGIGQIRKTFSVTPPINFICRAGKNKNDMYSWWLKRMRFQTSSSRFVIDMANKGYSSQSALYRLYETLSAKIEDGKEIHCIYVGDFDPSGLDMDRDLKDRLELFLGTISFTTTMLGAWI